MKRLIILPLLVCSLSSFAFAEEVELLNGETIILIEDEEDLEEEDNEIYYIEDEEDLWEEDENNTIVPIEDEEEEKEDELLSMIKKVIKALIIKGWELIVER